MLFDKWIKTGMILLAILFFSAGVLEMDAYARAGGSRSMGSRGSRSYSSPSAPSRSVSRGRPYRRGSRNPFGIRAQ